MVKAQANTLHGDRYFLFGLYLFHVVVNLIKNAQNQMAPNGKNTVSKRTKNVTNETLAMLGLLQLNIVLYGFFMVFNGLFWQNIDLIERLFSCS